MVAMTRRGHFYSFGVAQFQAFLLGYSGDPVAFDDTARGYGHAIGSRTDASGEGGG